MYHENDIFCGFTPEDQERVGRLLSVSNTPDPHVFTDEFGVKVDPSYCSWIAPLVGTVQTKPPFPRDYLADGIEFAAAAIALELASGNDSFTAVELGAGWGPWTSFVGICAARMPFKAINLVAFEADFDRFEFLRKHLIVNGILLAGAPNISINGRFNVSLHCAAAWWRNERLFWPIVTGGADAGLAAVAGNNKPETDYRGAPSNFRAIDGLAIQEISEGGQIDYLHMDVQGSERELVYNAIDFLTSGCAQCLSAHIAAKLKAT